MATGTPLVATTGGAIPEVAGPDGETCLAVPPGDAGALAAALTRLLGDAELRARLGAAGRERVLARFTWARAAQGTVARYREAMAMAGAGQDTGAARTGARAGALGPSAPASPAASDTPTGPAAAVSVPAADTSDRESRATC